MAKRLVKYKNGNYTVKLFSDGTKIKRSRDTEFKPSFPESIDCTITTKCNGGCKYCYLNCTEQGKHADLTNSLFDTLHSGTELALNANDLTHPQLEWFLEKMHDKGVICNLTINQIHLYDNISTLRKWQEQNLLYGVGISLVDSFDNRLIEATSLLDNVVIHVIDGCITKTDLENLSNHRIRLLILGFKIKGRGDAFYSAHKNEIEENISFLRNHLFEYRHMFYGFGFDNLATEHLRIRETVGEEMWEERHMADEGEFTYFIDAVNNKFAVSSTETDTFDMLDSTDEMFKFVRRKQGYEETI